MVEFEWESLGQMETERDATFADPRFQEWFSKMPDLMESGRRELFAGVRVGSAETVTASSTGTAAALLAELTELWGIIDELFGTLGPGDWSRKHGKDWTFAGRPLPHRLFRP